MTASGQDETFYTCISEARSEGQQLGHLPPGSEEEGNVQSGKETKPICPKPNPDESSPQAPAASNARILYLYL